MLDFGFKIAKDAGLICISLGLLVLLAGLFEAEQDFDRSSKRIKTLIAHPSETIGTIAQLIIKLKQLLVIGEEEELLLIGWPMLLALAIRRTIPRNHLKAAQLWF